MKMIMSLVGVYLVAYVALSVRQQSASHVIEASYLSSLSDRASAKGEPAPSTAGYPVELIAPITNASGTDVYAVGNPYVPGAIVCGSEMAVSYAVVAYEKHFVQSYLGNSGNATTGQQYLARPDLKAFGCAIVPAGMKLKVAEGPLHELVVQMRLTQDLVLRGVTSSAFLSCLSQVNVTVATGRSLLCTHRAVLRGVTRTGRFKTPCM